MGNSYSIDHIHSHIKYNIAESQQIHRLVTVSNILLGEGGRQRGGGVAYSSFNIHCGDIFGRKIVRSVCSSILIKIMRNFCSAVRMEIVMSFCKLKFTYF